MTVTEGTTEALTDLASVGSVLSETRERTHRLIERLSCAQLESVYSPLLSPLVWDLGHIAAFEDLWISRTFERSMVRPELMAVYDADETPRADRGKLEMLDVDGALDYMATVRTQTFELLEGSWDKPGAPAALNPDRIELIVRHEHQHNETMLQATQLAHLPSPFAAATERPASSAPASGLELVDIPGGTAVIGAPEGRFAYDNERGRHEVELDAFRLGRSPATNRDWQAFIHSGGYERREWWSAAGWDWRQRENTERPLYWSDDQRHWLLDQHVPIDPDAPVAHISFHEAEAFATAHGARLPTEFEWEWAATHDPAEGTQRPNPWGEGPVTRKRANVDQSGGCPAPAGSHPDGDSADGLHALIGDVWEWTASHFGGYPGFRAFPYREYSEQFFGDKYRVLRGGSWATRAHTAGVTLRNWDLPERRQIFSGLRLASDPQ